MEEMKQRQKVLDFLKSHRLAVVSTVNQESKPEAAVVAYVLKENFELWFATFDSSRKYHNLQFNTNIAFVVGWDHGKTVQYDGIAEELEDREFGQALFEELPIMPSIVKFIHQEQAVFYKVSPRWIRYSDFSTEPWERFEINIF